MNDFSESTVRQNNLTITIRLDGDAVTYPSFDVIFDLLKQCSLGLGYSTKTIEEYFGEQ